MNNKNNTKPPASNKPQTAVNKPQNKTNNQATGGQTTNFEYRVGDEISFAGANGIFYGTIIKLVPDPISPAVEIEFEDGRREVKKIKDRALRILRRASGKSEMDEKRGPGNKLRDYDIDEVRRGDIRRGSRH
jgi:hypothetical protein